MENSNIRHFALTQNNHNNLELDINGEKTPCEYSFDRVVSTTKSVDWMDTIVEHKIFLN